VSISVLIVEDHQATADGLALGLSREEDISVLGVCVDAKDGLNRARELKPDIILLDLHLPGSNGPKSMVESYLTVPGVKLVIFSAESRMAFIQVILSMGVSAYLLKSERVSTVCDTMRQVMNGAQGIISEELKGNFKKITRSEQEVLVMLGRGMKYQDIADQRVTSAATVRKQCETLLLKLGLESREQLIAWAVTNGFGNLEV